MATEQVHTAYCVQVGCQYFGSAWKFPASLYSTSYQSELEDIKLTLKIVNKTAATDGIRQYIGNMQAINSVNQYFYNPKQMLAPEADIILACHKLQREVRASTNPEWLQAHQNEHNRKEDLH